MYIRVRARSRVQEYRTCRRLWVSTSLLFRIQGRIIKRQKENEDHSYFESLSRIEAEIRVTTFRRITQLGSLFGAVGFIERRVDSDQDARCIRVAVAPSGKTYIFVNTTRF